MDATSRRTRAEEAARARRPDCNRARKERVRQFLGGNLFGK